MQYERVTKARHCPICGKDDWCAFTGDPGQVVRCGGGDLRRVHQGDLVLCERIASAPAGWLLVRNVNRGGLYAPSDAERVNDDKAMTPRNGRATSKTSTRVTSKASAPKVDFARIATEAAAAIGQDRKEELAKSLGVTVASIEAINVGWVDGPELRRLGAGFAGEGAYPDGAFCFPERCGDGRIVGLSLRATDGRKGACQGAARGLVIPSTLAARPDPVIVVEGASDTAAIEVLGLAGVGRPSNSSGAEDLGRLLDSREVLVLGERDAKASGAWPGRDGCRGVATKMAAARGEAVAWSLPPDNAKDIRTWLNSKVESGLDLADGEACRAAGRELLTALMAAAREVKVERKSQADHLVDLALSLYRPGRDESDVGVMVRIDGPNLAVPIGSSLKRALAKEYRRMTGKTPNAQALADAATALAGVADDCPKEKTHLRVARHNDDIILDQGTETGQCILVKGDGTGWEISSSSPRLMRRSALTGPMPDPVGGGNVQELQGLLALSDEDFPLVVAWLITAICEDLEVPILLLGGEQGTGKTTRARRIVGLIDPSPVELRSPPRDEENWAVTAAASWVIAVDNVSGIPQWWSDSLCRVATGDGHARRQRYTDGGVAAESYKRPVILTSIDVGHLRGDLGDRVLLLDCPVIPDSRRCRASELRQQWELARPRVLGALLETASKALAHLPEVELAEAPRMADYGYILAAVDNLLGTAGLRRYMDQRGRVHTDCLEADPVAMALIAMMATERSWEGSATALHARLTPERPPAKWPRDGRDLGARLTRAAPALRHAGIVVERDRTPKTGGRVMRITRLEKTAETLSPLSPPSPVGPTSTSAPCHPPCHPPEGDKPLGEGWQVPEGLVGAVRDKPDKGDKPFGNNSGSDVIPPGWTPETWAAVVSMGGELPGEPVEAPVVPNSGRPPSEVL